MLSHLLILLLACASEPEPLRYTVVRGDTLSIIAKRHGVTVEQIRAWNGIMGDRIEVGQVLVLESIGAVATAKEAPKRPKGTGKRAPGLSVTPPGLSVAPPQPEPCVPFNPELGDEGMAAPEGLDRATVKRGLDAVLPLAQGCPFPTGRTRIVFELVIGCDGLVRSLEVSDPDGASKETIDCAKDALRLADFPAHDMADGMPVTYPLTIDLD